MINTTAECENRFTFLQLVHAQQRPRPRGEERHQSCGPGIAVHLNKKQDETTRMVAEVFGWRRESQNLGIHSDTSQRDEVCNKYRLMSSML